jgi:hypothetical protein
MGYYTSYSLGIVVDANASLLGDSRRVEIMKHILEMAKDDNYYWGIFAGSIEEELAHSSKYDQWSAEESHKWYEYDQDMKALSLKFQDVIFMLHGEGEDEDDKWNKYYLNGRVQVCHAIVLIEYPEFDLNELKTIEDKS